MKLKQFLLLAMLGMAGFALQSCSDDDEDTTSVPTALTEALTAAHSGAQNVTWETRGTYYVADFTEYGYEKEAWFTTNATWQMTETDIPSLSSLPQAVQEAFAASQYATWQVDDIDLITRNGLESLYVIEVEQANQEVELHYSTDGVLIKAEVDTDNDDDAATYLSTVTQSTSLTLTEHIETLYPGARIIEIETEHGTTEVDIIHDGMLKEVLLSSEMEWISTSWDVRISNLPQAVASAAQALYPTYQIDDAEYVETPSSSYYLLEMEQGEAEVYIKVTAEGVVLI